MLLDSLVHNLRSVTFVELMDERLSQYFHQIKPFYLLKVLEFSVSLNDISEVKRKTEILIMCGRSFRIKQKKIKLFLILPINNNQRLLIHMITESLS